ncbi:MAG: DUF2232 domain-containing protein, partial [Oscillospiraceae bacterium]
LNASAGGHGISNMLDTLFENVKSTTAVMVKTLTDSGKFKDVDLAKVFGVLIDNMRVMIEVYMPSILICTAAVMSYFVTMFCMFVMRRCNIKAIKPLEFSMIKVPKNVCYVAVVLFLITMFSHDSSRLTAALNNMVTILYFCVCVDGLSFVDFKLKQQIPKQYLRTIIYIAAFLVGYMFIGVVINILIILGMLDMTLDFRRIKGAGDYNGENE